MKKTIALAAGLAGMALSPAFAQSSVTLYGLMDAGLAHIDNVAGASSNQVRSGSALTSRFGLRGSEDLGGGLSAIFNLESGIWADTGAIQGDFFQRQSWIGLRSASFGEVTAGRLLPSISDVLIGSTQAPYLGNPTATIDGAVYTRQENALNVQGNDADVFTMYARVPLSPQWIVMGGLQFQNDKSVQNYDVRQVNLGANYVLSKRTWLYALYSHQTVKNGGKAGMYSATSDSDKQNQFSTGVVHTF